MNGITFWAHNSYDGNRSRSFYEARHVDTPSADDVFGVDMFCDMYNSLIGEWLCSQEDDTMTPETFWKLGGKVGNESIMLDEGPDCRYVLHKWTPADFTIVEGKMV